MRDLVKTLSAVLSVLVVIIVSRKFIRVLAQVIEGQIASDTLMVILGLKMLIACVTFLPAATFMAVLMVLGRMYRDQEMAAISSAGGGVWTIYRAVFFVLLPLSVAATGLSLTVSPWAESQIEARTHHDQESADCVDWLQENLVNTAVVILFFMLKLLMTTNNYITFLCSIDKPIR
jgi:lipopolysaccharide export system permease protein